MVFPFIFLNPFATESLGSMSPLPPVRSSALMVKDTLSANLCRVRRSLKPH